MLIITKNDFITNIKQALEVKYVIDIKKVSDRRSRKFHTRRIYDLTIDFQIINYVGDLCKASIYQKYDIDAMTRDNQKTTESYILEELNNLVNNIVYKNICDGVINFTGHDNNSLTVKLGNEIIKHSKVYFNSEMESTVLLESKINFTEE